MQCCHLVNNSYCACYAHTVNCMQFYHYSLHMSMHIYCIHSCVMEIDIIRPCVCPSMCVSVHVCVRTCVCPYMRVSVSAVCALMEAHTSTQCMGDSTCCKQTCVQCHSLDHVLPCTGMSAHYRTLSVHCIINYTQLLMNIHFLTYCIVVCTCGSTCNSIKW